MPKGFDLGTSFLVSASKKKDKISYKEHRDAFFIIKPSTPIAAKMIESGLKGKAFFKNTDGNFVVVGQDAIDKAVERNSSARRPLHKGVISPKEKDALPILKFMVKHLLGEPDEENETVAYSIPAQPVDQDAEEFDTGYHEDVMGNFLKELGYRPVALNEAEAVAYSELMDDGLTGLTLSHGAGQINACLMSSGEPIVKWSITRSGDYVDSMAAQATNQQETVIQVEKEAGGFSLLDDHLENPIHRALVVYYRRLINYEVQHLADQLNNSDALPKFKEALPIIITGGTSKVDGFLEVFKEELAKVTLPFEVKEVRLAKDQLRSVARGCLIGAEVL